MTRPNTHYPTLASLFRTIAPPYCKASYLHKLFSDNEEDLKNHLKRKYNALLHPTEIEWVTSLLAELDVTYLSQIRYSMDWYVARNEHGNNGNPHWHSVLYSSELGKITFDRKNAIEEAYKDKVNEIDQAATSEVPHIYTENEREIVQEEVKKKFEEGQRAIIQFFDGCYVNWNPSYTHNGELTDTYENPDLSTISLCTMIDDALNTGDFTLLDKLICDIIQTSCRHILHRGKDGKPHKKDYCYRKDTRVDKERSTIDILVSIVKEYCSRRKPQPTRPEPAIYSDPHDRKMTQLSFASNDGYFNGADPFAILNNLGNADTKALVPPMFCKCPKVLIAEDGTKLELYFYLHDTADPIEYVLKYITKSNRPMKTDNEIMKLVLDKIEHENIFSSKIVYSMYAQHAIQFCICLLNVQHVNIGLPQIFRNTKCKAIKKKY